MTKYIRNSGKVKEKELTTKEAKELSIYQQQLAVGKKLKEDINWIDELAKTEKFSFEWVHTVLEELLFQCMGKRDVIMGYSGNEKLIKVFKEKPAIEIIGMIAKMNGHLFDTVKGQINKTVNEQVTHTIELKPDANRTAQVFNILEECGALKPEPKQLSNSEVEQVYPA